MEPIGKLRFHSAETVDVNKHVVEFKIYVADENSDLYFYEKKVFKFDLVSAAPQPRTETPDAP